MMKAIFLSGLSAFLLMAAVVEAQATPAAYSEFNSLSYPHLIDIDQSQVETLSMADGATRLPVSAFRVAAVHFITNDGGQAFSGFGDGGMEFEDPSAIQCQGEGYQMTDCADGNPGDVCPYNSSYFKECCDKNYKYTVSNCEYPNVLSTDSCGGKHRCVCDEVLYPVTSCVSPQVPVMGSGSSCTAEGTTYYADCVCPEVYAESCTGAHLKGKGIGCTKNGETKYLSCECEAGYNLTCSGDGRSPAKPSDYCLKDGIKYYRDCKDCENKCSLASCPAGVLCEKEACSGKYCDIGCAVGHKDLDNYWCGGALRCWVK